MCRTRSGRPRPFCRGFSSLASLGKQTLRFYLDLGWLVCMYHHIALLHFYRNSIDTGVASYLFP